MDPVGYVLGRTEDRGEGVFATRFFLRGQLVVVGEIARWLEHNNLHASQVGPSEYVLLAGVGPKVNHSCDPNCGVRLNESGAYDLVARRDIAPGEEITFDYAMRNYSIEHFPAQCRCGGGKLPWLRDGVERSSR